MGRTRKRIQTGGRRTKKIYRGGKEEYVERLIQQHVENLFVDGWKLSVVNQRIYWNQYAKKYNIPTSDEVSDKDEHCYDANEKFPLTTLPDMYPPNEIGLTTSNTTLLVSPYWYMHAGEKCTGVDEIDNIENALIEFLITYYQKERDEDEGNWEDINEQSLKDNQNRDGFKQVVRKYIESLYQNIIGRYLSVYFPELSRQLSIDNLQLNIRKVSSVLSIDEQKRLIPEDKALKSIQNIQELCDIYNLFGLTPPSELHTVAKFIQYIQSHTDNINKYNGYIYDLDVLMKETDKKMELAREIRTNTHKLALVHDEVNNLNAIKTQIATLKDGLITIIHSSNQDYSDKQTDKWLKTEHVLTWNTIWENAHKVQLSASVSAPAPTSGIVDVPAPTSGIVDVPAPTSGIVDVPDVDVLMKDDKSIDIKLKDTMTNLAIDDCITFDRQGRNITAKILGFDKENDADNYVSYIYYQTWRPVSNMWASLPLRFDVDVTNPKGYKDTYPRIIRLRNAVESPNSGNWTTIVKLSKCPVPVHLSDVNVEMPKIADELTAELENISNKTVKEYITSLTNDDVKHAIILYYTIGLVVAGKDIRDELYKQFNTNDFNKIQI
jgi:hypothetical protein